MLPIEEASIDRTTTISFLSRNNSSQFLIPNYLSTAVNAVHLSDAFSPRRARGISTLALGCGPSAGKLFALGIDSRVHVYNAYGAAGVPLSYESERDGDTDSAFGAPLETYSHPGMVTNSFYVRIGVSPCGRWLASGSTSGSAYLFDISQSSYRGQLKSTPQWEGIQLPGQHGEVGALDWGYETLATCADDGTVRVWQHVARVASPY